MGWKASMIIVECPSDPKDDEALLSSLGFNGLDADGEWTLEECIYPNQKAVGVGFFNGNLIICDNYCITKNTIDRNPSRKLTEAEQVLVDRFPSAEIVSVACHSGVNYHGYSVIQSGKKVRAKTVSADQEVEGFGDWVEEETEIYKTSYEQDGERLWKDEHDEENPYQENELMEDFTFGMAKRRLGVRVDFGEGIDLFSNTPFRKYSYKSFKGGSLEDKPRSKWRTIILVAAAVIIWRLLRQFVFND